MTKTPEEIAEELWYSLSDLDEPSIAAIAAAIRKAIEEEREACAAICETDAGEITVLRISRAMGDAQHAAMRAEAAALQTVAAKIRDRKTN